MEDILSTITSRRSVRNFETQTPEKELINKVNNKNISLLFEKS